MVTKLQLNRSEEASNYKALADQWEETINAVFWNETEGSWFDYIIYPGQVGHKTEFYPGNILPLILNISQMSTKTEKVLKYLDGTGVLDYPGGIPSSLETTGEQWDFPNGWAPHIHWFVESLEGSGDEKAAEYAKQTAERWIKNNYLTYATHNRSMFEKYDVQNVGSAGGGGEYEVVVGFGWSNGAVMDLLVKYGDQLQAPSLPGEDPEGPTGGSGLSLVSVPVVLVAVLVPFFHCIFEF